jgi:Uma2 family endonuclease
VNKPISGLTPATRVRFTTADFQRMIEAGAFEDMWVELIDGELERMPPPGRPHGRGQMGLVVRLLDLFGEARVLANVGVDLGSDTVVGPDIMVLKAKGDDSILVTADELLLVVEVAFSSHDRDLHLKRRLYARAGVPTYWVLDLDRRAVHVFDQLDGEDYRDISVVRFGEPLAVPGSEATITLE